MTNTLSVPTTRPGAGLGSLAALVLLAGCVAPGEGPGEVRVESMTSALPAEAVTVVSEGGGWKVSWWLDHDALQPAELFDHGLFDVRVALRTAGGELPGPGVELIVDAGMPQHRHGMNVVPELEELGPGEYRVAGLLFHMPGDWTMTFDVVSGALSERAQVVLGVE